MEVIIEKPATTIAVKNILFATDFSEVSEAALPYVAAFSRHYGSQIHLAHVLPEVTFLRPGAPDPSVIGSIYEDAHSNAQEKMQSLAGRLNAFPHRTYVRHGETAQVLVDLVHEQNIDMLIAGTHGRTGLGKLIMGSVAEEIFRQAPCPVLTVGPNVVGAAVRNRAHGELRPPQIEIGDVLYATDFKQQSEEAVEWAALLAREFHASLALLHVIED